MREEYYPQIQAESTGTDFFGALWRRKWLVLLVIALSLAAGVLAKRFMTPLWRADAQMIMVYRTGSMRNGAYDPSYTSPNEESVETQIGMLQTAEMAERTEDWLKNRALLTGQDQSVAVMPPGELQHSITVTNPKGSTLINVEVDAKSHEQALIVANAVVQSFVQWKKELAQADVQKSLITMQRQTDAARLKMEATQRKLLAYQKSHGVVDATAQASGVIGALQTNAAEIRSIQEELQAQQTETNALNAQLKIANNGIKQYGGRNDQLTSTLQGELSDLQLQRNVLARKVTPLYPGGLPQLDAQIKDIQQRLNVLTRAAQDGTVPSLPTQAALLQSYQQSQITLDTTQARLAQAEQARDQLSQQMAALPQTGSDYGDLSRQADIAIGTYQKQKDALDAARMEENRLNGDVQISQSAIGSDFPFKPNNSQNILVALFIGSALALGLALLVDNTNRRLRTENQMERLSAGPILGALPQLSRPALALLQRRQLPAPVAETYSLTGANLLRVLGQPMPGNGHVVLVTSAQPGEGKSLTAVETARALARAGKRVILVDADLRNPSLKGRFAEARETGLVEVLSGQVSLVDALVESETPNLSVLFGSAAKVNSADVLASAHMSNFLKMVRGHADIILLDAPSCTVVDPLLMAPSVDFVLQVVNLGRAGETAVYSTVSALVGLAPLGFFVNRTSKKNAPAYEVARSFAATSYPRLTEDVQMQALPQERTMLMYRNSSAYAKNGTEPAGDDNRTQTMPIPLHSREDL